MMKVAPVVPMKAVFWQGKSKIDSVGPTLKGCEKHVFYKHFIVART